MKYAGIEKDMKSTFFLIPFKDQPGNGIPVQIANAERKIRYIRYLQNSKNADGECVLR